MDLPWLGVCVCVCVCVWCGVKRNRKWVFSYVMQRLVPCHTYLRAMNTDNMITPYILRHRSDSNAIYIEVLKVFFEKICDCLEGTLFCASSKSYQARLAKFFP